MGHGAAVAAGALVPVASTDSGVECGWDCMAGERLVYLKYSPFFCEKQMKLPIARQLRCPCEQLISWCFSLQL